MAYSNHSQRAPRIPWFCSFYMQIHPKLQYNGLSTHFPVEKQAQVSVLEPRSQTCHAVVKDHLQNPPLLAYPDLEKPFVVEVDASTSGDGSSRRRSDPNSFHVLSSPGNCPRRSRTKISVTGSNWPSSSP